MASTINVQSKRNRRTIERARPTIEAGDEIRGLFLGQTLIPPRWSYPLLFIALLFSRGGAIVVTDRNVYEFAMGFLGRLKLIRHKTPLGMAKAVPGGCWSLQIDKGKRLYALPGSGRGVRDEIAALINQSAPG